MTLSRRCLWFAALLAGCSLTHKTQGSVENDPESTASDHENGTETPDNEAPNGDGELLDMGPLTQTETTGREAPDGVRMLYPTVAGGDEWFFQADNPSGDGRFDLNGVELSHNSDGSWKVAPGVTRINVFSRGSGIMTSKARVALGWQGYAALVQRGYWHQPDDFKNVEVTGYVRVTNAPAGADLSWVVRSIRHTKASEKDCGGAAYHTNIGIDDGRFRVKKEQYHINYDVRPYAKEGIGDIRNKWIGFKGVFYNQSADSVKLECWVDAKNDNNWVKVYEYLDTGNWGDSMDFCGAPSKGAILPWGSPMIIYKATDVTYDIQKLSIREIQPPSS